MKFVLVDRSTFGVSLTINILIYMIISEHIYTEQ